jgi:predicted acetyltransferase
MTQNMRGRLFPVSGVWGVSTFPSARRKGYCRQAMAAVLSSERDSGKVLSNLYPFRESFYERLGYVAFPLTKIARFTTRDLAPVLKIETGGDVHLQPVSDGFEAYRAYIARMRETKHGMAFFDVGDRSGIKRFPAWMAWADFDGETEGVMLYRTLGEEVTKLKFFATRFYYQTSRARYLLLNWIARHVDQAEQVELWLSADEYPETWLADSGMKVESAIRPAMSRVLEVGKLGGMPVGEGSFSARIIDPLCPWNEGVWEFNSNQGRLEVTESQGAACELTIQGLTSLITGVHDPQDFSLRGWGNPGEGTQAVLSKMFPRMNPYMHEYF